MPKTKLQAIGRPEALDKWGKGGCEILIHMVEKGYVYFDEIVDGRSFLGCGRRMPVDEFCRLMAGEGAEYLGGKDAR